MKKHIVSLLGIFLLGSPPSLYAMDTDTFSYLLTLYSNKEITRLELINAYADLSSKKDLQLAQDTLKQAGISIDRLIAESENDRAQFALTFQEMIEMFQKSEISIDQLIAAYNLFETTQDKEFADTMLQAFLSKSIDQLKSEKETLGRVARSSDRFSGLHNVPTSTRRSGQRSTIPTRITPPTLRVNRGHNRQVERHFEIVRARNKRRQLARTQKVRNEQEKNSPTTMANVPEKIDHEAIKPLKIDPAGGKSTEKSSLQEESTGSVESLTALLAHSRALHEQQSTRIPRIDIPEKTNEKSVGIELSEFQGTTKKKEKKKVRFSLPTDSSNAHTERINLLRSHAPVPAIQREPLHETIDESADQFSGELSVHLAAKGTPVFSKGTTLFNPSIAEESFTQSIRELDSPILHQWGHKLASLTFTDEKRAKALKPLFHIFKQDDAPRERLSLLIQPTAQAFIDTAKLEEVVQEA